MPSRVVQRGDRFAARIIVRGRQVWLGTHATREEALEVAERARSAHSGDVETVAGWVVRWPEVASSRRARSEATIAGTVRRCRAFVERFGAVRLDDLDPVDVVAWAGGRPGDARYVRTVLEDAVWLRLLERNPMVGVSAPAARPKVWLSVEDVEALIVEGRGPLRAFTAVAAFSGMRLFEVAALVRRDVLRPADRGGLYVAVRAGKGSKSREVVLFRRGVEELHGWFGRRIVYPDELVFQTRDRRAWTRKSVNKAWRKMCERAGVDAPFKALRDFHASWLLDQGVAPVDIAVQLGHWDRSGRPNITLIETVYGRPDHGAALKRVASVA